MTTMIRPDRLDLRSLRDQWLPGSSAQPEWTWDNEIMDLVERDLDQIMKIIRSGQIRKPALLGDDGRVWDGHHRIVAAILRRDKDIPVKYADELLELE